MFGRQQIDFKKFAGRLRALDLGALRVRLRNGSHGVVAFQKIKLLTYTLDYNALRHGGVTIESKAGLRERQRAADYAG
ncbi:MAG: hypothetical protein BroJett039_08880 [Chloroflexota bacterium]|nr:MAG: hypothetical protein BroJett039_08880 [Chloroflexota bacterium]